MFKKKLFSISILIFTFVSLFFWIFWETYAKNDCELLTDGLRSISEIYADNISQMYPKEDVQIAIDHLIYFCCENWYAKKSKHCPPQDGDWKLLESKLYAQSPYLYDQILDIWLRRLDGDMNAQYEEAWLDKVGRERRERIRTASQLTNWLIPKTVIEKYKYLRKPWADDDDGFSSNNITIISEKWEKYWLKNRYFAMCYISDYIESVINSDIDIDDKIKTQKQTKKCFWLVDEIIQQEFAYMKWVMIQQWARLVSHNMKTYTDEYFTRWRLQPVLEKFANMQAMFLMINQKVNEWTNQCTKK